MIVVKYHSLSNDLPDYLANPDELNYITQALSQNGINVSFQQPGIKKMLFSAPLPADMLMLHFAGQMKIHPLWWVEFMSTAPLIGELFGQTLPEDTAEILSHLLEENIDPDQLSNEQIKAGMAIMATLGLAPLPMFPPEFLPDPKSIPVLIHETVKDKDTIVAPDHDTILISELVAVDADFVLMLPLELPSSQSGEQSNNSEEVVLAK